MLETFIASSLDKTPYIYLGLYELTNFSSFLFSSCIPF